jgi:hypothetical protein
MDAVASMACSFQRYSCTPTMSSHKMIAIA